MQKQKIETPSNSVSNLRSMFEQKIVSLSISSINLNFFSMLNIWSTLLILRFWFNYLVLEIAEWRENEAVADL